MPDSNSSNPPTFAPDQSRETGCFDINFTKFLTPLLIKILWVMSIIMTLGIAFVVVPSIVVLQVPEKNKAGAFLIACLVGCVPAAGWLVFVRLTCEAFIVLFKVEKHARKIEEHLRKDG